MRYGALAWLDTFRSSFLLGRIVVSHAQRLAATTESHLQCRWPRSDGNWLITCPSTCQLLAAVTITIEAYSPVTSDEDG